MNNNETPLDAKYDFRGQPQGTLVVFMNDLVYFMDRVHVCDNAYADDEQIYDSDKDPVEIRTRDFKAIFSKLTTGSV